MENDNQKPAPAEQDTGLIKDAQETSTKEGQEKINFFDALDPFYKSRIKHGEYNPEFLLRALIYFLTPEEVRQLMKDPENRGLYSEDENEIRYWVQKAAWQHETLVHESFIEDYRHYIFIRHFGNKAVVLHWDGQEYVHQTVPSFKNSHIDRFVAYPHPKTGALERHNFADAWLYSQKVSRYERVRFGPDTKLPPNEYNLWRGWPHREYDDGNSDKATNPIGCELFLEHVAENVCGGEEELFQYLLGWMADALQNPHRTSRVAVVLRGPQGSGKSLFAKLFGELFAPHNLLLNQPDQLVGNFNKHLMDKCIVVADEAFFAGNRQHAATLKTLITSEEIFVEPKGVDGFKAPKLFRLIIASNDEHVIRAEIDDRRFLVLNVDAGAQNNSEDYFSAILREWKEGGAGTLFRWLRGSHWRNKLESGEWTCEKRPKTRALEQQKDFSLDTPEMVILNMLREGEPPCSFVPDAGKIFVATRMLAEAARLTTKDEKTLGEALRAIAMRDANGQPENARAWINKEQRRGFWLPPLAQARVMWEVHKKRSVEWPSDVVDWALDPPCPL